MKTLEALSLDKDWQSFLKYRDQKLQGIQSGFANLDRSLLGLTGVVVIQGAPGANKSTLALQVASYQAAQGNPVLVLDRENGFNRMRMRMLCQANRKSQTEILTCSKEDLRKYVETVRKYPVYLCTDPVDDIKVLNGYLKSIAEKYPSRPLMLVVDSIQAMPKLHTDPRLSIDAWLMLLDQAKLDWDGRLTILATSEKKRGGDGLEYERASLGAGKGSGSIEYKSELVFDLRRNYETQGITLEVLKNRDGHSGFTLEFGLERSNPSNASSFCYRLKESGL